jgi:hypothetical protein
MLKDSKFGGGVIMVVVSSSALDRCPHYDMPRAGYNHLLRILKKRNPACEHLSKGTMIVNQGMHKLFLTNKDKFQIKTGDLNLEGIFCDSIIYRIQQSQQKCRLQLGTIETTGGFSLLTLADTPFGRTRLRA